MKSKSFDTRQKAIDNIKQNRSFDFVKLYKSAAETPMNPAPGGDAGNENNSIPIPTTDSPKRERSPNKTKKKKVNETLDLSNIENGASPSEKTLKKINNAKITSTPNLRGAKPSDGNVKSIMKNKPRVDEPLDISQLSISSSKPKKRNKSVSFMLEETDEVATKKTKANESAKEEKDTVKDIKNKDKLINKKLKKEKKNLQPGKENKLVENQENVKPTVSGSVTSKSDQVPMKAKRKSERVKDATDTTISMKSAEQVTNEVNKKVQKSKKSKLDDDNTTSDPAAEIKSKKSKKKKYNEKPLDGVVPVDGEPVQKARKKEKVIKPDVIAKGLENLNIGDNAHTLSNLLDEMTVADKNKKKKNKQKMKKDILNKKVKKAANNSAEKVQTEGESNGGEKETVKWMKRKWNKDKKATLTTNKLLTSVVVGNLPISIMLTYKSSLSEHFSKFGPIASVGIAEANPTEDPKLVFTTTIHFQDEESATKALEEDNALFEGARIRVSRPLPPGQTTLFVRSYGELSEQALSTVFTSAGRIRSIHLLVKGKKAMNTAYVEFDGPEAIKNAIKLAEEVQKIGSKNIYAAKYDENRRKKRKTIHDAGNEENGVESDSDE